MNSKSVKARLKSFYTHPLVKTPATIIIVTLLIILVLFIFLHIFTRHGKGFPIPDFSGMNSKEVMSLARSYRLRVEVTDSVYIMSREPGIVIEQNPKAGAYVKPQRRVFLVMNAMNPKLVEMPNVVGVSLRQAKSKLELQGFTIGSLSFTPDIAVNIVLEQRFQSKRIQPRSLIPMGSRIDLILGRGLANEQTVLPSLIGLTSDGARNVLLYASLNMGRLTFDETVKDYQDSLIARVYSQYPMPQNFTPIAFGSRVDVWLTLNEQRIPRPTNAPTLLPSQPEFVEPEEEVLE